MQVSPDQTNTNEAGTDSGKKSRKKVFSPEQRARRAEIKAMQQKRDESKRTKDTIMGLITIAIGIFIFVSVQFHAAGEFGNELGIILKGLFGLFGWIFPWYLVIMGVLFMTHRTVHVSKKALLLSFVLLLFLCSLNSARFIDSSDLKFTIDRFYQDGTTLDGGGLFGMLSGTLIVKLLGKAGLVIFSLTFIMICIFLLLNTPLTRWIDDVKNKLEEKRLISAMEAARREEELREMEEAVEAERKAEIVKRWEEKTNSAAAPAADPASQAAPYYGEKPLSETERRKRDKRSSADTMDFCSQLGGIRLFKADAGKKRKSNVFEFLKNNDPFTDKGSSGKASYGLDETERTEPAGGSEGPAGRTDSGPDETAAAGSDRAKEVRPPVKIGGYGLEDASAVSPGYGLDGGTDKAPSTGIGLEEARVVSPGYGLDEGSSEPANPGADSQAPGRSDSDSQAPGSPEPASSDPDSEDSESRESAAPDPASKVSASPELISEQLSSEESEAPESIPEESPEKREDTADPGADIYQDLYNAFRSPSQTAAKDSSGIIGSGSGTPRGEAPGDPFDDDPEAETDPAQAPVFSTEKPKLDAATARKTASEAAEGLKTSSEIKIHYKKPAIDLLDEPVKIDMSGLDQELREKAQILEDTMESFNVDAYVTQVTKGPSVTRYEVQPGTGVKVKSIVQLADDIALNLRAKSIRIEAPIPGKAAVGIEVENEKINMVKIREIIDSGTFKEEKSKIAFALGKDIAGNSIVPDLKGMPHLLIAGSTGSGKSVCINSIITSIMYRADPSEVKLVLIDPKVVELGDYNGIPHLLIPVVTDPAKAAAALSWAVVEMTDRYKAFADASVRDIAGYNKKMKSENMEDSMMPQVVIIIDELADLMMAAPKQVEESIVRLAQLARAAGMHLIVATQRPSVDIITGLIKANIPSRIAFAVSSQYDSKTILDMNGAEKLVGKGDMLFKPLGKGKPLRVQGTFISDEEIRRVIDFVKGQNLQPKKADDVIDMIENGNGFGLDTEGTDELLPEAIDFVVDSGKASVSMLQRRFRIGYNRAASIMDMMEERGIVTPQDGSRPRQILMTKEDLQPAGGEQPLGAAQ